MALGTGMAWSNSRAVISGLFGRKEEFKRTPKYASRGQENKYLLRLNSSMLGEIGLATYALAGAVLACWLAPTFVPYLMVYVVAFGFVGLWGLREHLVLQRAAA
jgi:hypothetical protein